MDIKSIIKNAIAERLHESVKIEEPKTPEINTTSEFVNYLAEAVKFKIEELSIDTMKSYRKKATAQDPAETPMKREVGIQKATTKIDRAQRRQKTSGEGYDRGVHVQKHGAAADPDAAAKRSGVMSPEKIRGAGLAGKTVGGKPRTERLANKMAKIDKGNSAMLSKIAKKEN